MSAVSPHATIEERVIAALPSFTLPRLPAVRITRTGGLSFLRIGRLQLSWCLCRKPRPFTLDDDHVAHVVWFRDDRLTNEAARAKAMKLVDRLGYRAALEAAKAAPFIRTPGTITPND